MHGVPKDLPLAVLVGDSLVQICIGQNELIFRFRDAGSITVQGEWELTDIAGQVIDRSMEQAARDVYRIHAILGSPVTSFLVESPAWFSLTFASGATLRVFDDSAAYESFSVEATGVAGVHV